LKIQTDSFAEPVELFQGGSVLTFTPSANGKRLIILGVVSNEFSSSIWEYDVDLASLKCVVPCTDGPFRFAKRVEPIRVSLDLPSGRKSFQLKLPPDFDRRQIRCYPLVIASQYMKAYTSAFANCGAVCAWLERSSLDKDAVENEKEDILAVYKFLTENPAVDPERVFLVGSCAETTGLIQLCTTNPTPWKGLILWSPIDLPDIQALASARHAPKILISTGSGFGGENADQRIRKYQQDASNAGLGVDVSIYGGATHELIAQLSIRERMRVTMNFLFAD
jgi:predicted esterase